jgi:hypothetical protein
MDGGWRISVDGTVGLKTMPLSYQMGAAGMAGEGGQGSCKFRAYDCYVWSAVPLSTPVLVGSHWPFQHHAPQGKKKPFHPLAEWDHASDSSQVPAWFPCATASSLDGCSWPHTWRTSTHSDCSDPAAPLTSGTHACVSGDACTSIPWLALLAQFTPVQKTQPAHSQSRATQRASWSHGVTSNGLDAISRYK